MLRALSIVSLFSLTIGLSIESAAQPTQPAKPVKGGTVAASPPPKVNLVFQGWAPRALPSLRIAPPQRHPLATKPIANSPSAEEGKQLLPTSDRSLDSREQLRGMLTTQVGQERLVTLDRIAELSVKIAVASPAPGFREEALKDSLAVVNDPDFATYPKAEAALARLATVQAQAARLEDAHKTYTQLVAKFPKSLRVADAFAFFGDRAYDRKDMKEAIASYEKALAIKAPIATYARYKLAWAAFNTGDHKRALQLFTTVATTGTEPFRSAAASDAMRVYVEVGQPTAAIAFAERLDRTRALELARAVAEAYSDRGNAAGAKALWTAIAKREKTTAIACTDHVRAFAATIALDDRAEILRAARALTAIAATGGSECSANIDQRVGEVAYAWHLQRDRTAADPAQTLAMWAISQRLATDAIRKEVIARNIAIATWAAAAYNGGARAQAWIDAATLLEASGEKDLGNVVIDAWDNALRAAKATKPLTPAQQARVKAGLEKLNTPRAKALLEAMTS